MTSCFFSRLAIFVLVEVEGNRNLLISFISRKVVSGKKRPRCSLGRNYSPSNQLLVSSSGDYHVMYNSTHTHKQMHRLIKTSMPFRENYFLCSLVRNKEEIIRINFRNKEAKRSAVTGSVPQTLVRCSSWASKQAFQPRPTTFNVSTCSWLR